jgi:hypothetical protein
VVGSQIGNLTTDPSFGHNLCFKYLNMSCEPILDIYVPRAFNDIKNFSTQWILTPVIALWKFRSPSGLQLPKWELIGSSFLHFPTLLGAQNVTPNLHSQPAPLQAFALVISPRLRLRQLNMFMYYNLTWE